MQERVEVEDGYHCPFCPDHEDDEFVLWNGYLEQPICLGCSYDLYYDLTDHNPPQKTLDIIEQLTGQPSSQLVKKLLKETILFRETNPHDPSSVNQTIRGNFYDGMPRKKKPVRPRKIFGWNTDRSSSEKRPLIFYPASKKRESATPNHPLPLYKWHKKPKFLLRIDEKLSESSFIRRVKRYLSELEYSR